jgi:cell division transport system permease protein
MSTYSRRQQIGIMKAVGATNAFIRIPFVVEGVVIGIASAMGAIGLLKIISELLASFLKDFLPFMKSFVGINLDITLMFLAVGVFCGLVGGSMSIGRYLRREGGKAIE